MGFKAALIALGRGKMVFLLALAVVGLAVQWTAKEHFLIKPSGIQHDSGLCYVSNISSLGHNIFSALPDSITSPRRSKAVFLESGIKLGPAHSLLEDIRKIGRGRFSHWKKGRLYFSSSDGSDPRASGKQYSFILTMEFVPWLRFLGWIFLSMFFLFFFSCYKVVSKVLFFLMMSGFVVAIILAVFYLVTVVAGFIAGHAAPPASIYIFFPLVKPLAYFEPNLPYFILGWALLGALLSWFALILGQEPLISLAKRISLFKRWGFFLCLALFLFYLGSSWSGAVRSTDMHSMSVAGFMPFSDAGGYYSDTGLQAMSGRWSEFFSRRPLAAALCSALMLGVGGNYIGFLMGQACLLALVAWLAVAAIIRWRGIWLGTAFLALLSIMARPFLPTLMTETMGLTLALVALIFFMGSLQENSYRYYLLGLASMVLALFVRMGPMFMLPALIAWGCWAFRSASRSLARILITSLFIVVMCWGMTKALLAVYGAPGSLQGGNFSYVLVGLSADQNYQFAYDHYAKDLAVFKTAREQNLFLYGEAIKNIKSRPEVFFRTIIKHGREFLKLLPRKIFSGYSGLSFPDWLFFGFLGLCIFGWGAMLFLRKASLREISFFGLSFLGLLFSAPFVITDDGWRVIMVGYPILWLALVYGLDAPAVFQDTNPENILKEKGRWLFRSAAGILFVFLLGALIAPAFAHYIAKRENLPDIKRSLERAGAVLLRSGNDLAGMLVLPDGEVLDPSIPSVHFSDFVTIIRDFTWFELSNPLITPTPPSPPFALIRSKTTAPFYFLCPVDVLTRKDVPFWMICFEPWPVVLPLLPKYRVWSKVTELSPVSRQGDVGSKIVLGSFWSNQITES